MRGRPRERTWVLRRGFEAVMIARLGLCRYACVVVSDRGFEDRWACWRIHVPEVGWQRSGFPGLCTSLDPMG